jgi:hypothetical protein
MQRAKYGLTSLQAQFYVPALPSTVIVEGGLYVYFAGSYLEMAHQASAADTQISHASSEIRTGIVFDLRITPGIHPNMVSRMLMRKSAPHPVLKKTARGGRNIARK